MAKLSLTKIDAVQRQIDGAIGLLFSDGDSVPVPTLAFAAYRVLIDLSKSHNNQKITDFISRMEDRIKPERLDEFYRYVYAPENFLKHADRDPNDVLSGIDEEYPDIILFMSCVFCAALGHQLTGRMKVFYCWGLVHKNPQSDQPSYP